MRVSPDDARGSPSDPRFPASPHAAAGRIAPSLFHLLQDITVAKPNYNFEKRQREIAKKKQQDEKQAKKRAARENNKPADTASEPPADPQ
jgi:hypothetical protein